VTPPRSGTACPGLCGSLGRCRSPTQSLAACPCKGGSATRRVSQPHGARQVAGQGEPNSRVGGVQVAGHQGQPHSRDGLGPPSVQDLHVRVTATQEQELSVHLLCDQNAQDEINVAMRCFVLLALQSTLPRILLSDLIWSKPRAVFKMQRHPTHSFRLSSHKVAGFNRDQPCGRLAVAQSLSSRWASPDVLGPQFALLCSQVSQTMLSNSPPMSSTHTSNPTPHSAQRSHMTCCWSCAPFQPATNTLCCCCCCCCPLSTQAVAAQYLIQ
jgi:hypothetical protein